MVKVILGVILQYVLYNVLSAGATELEPPHPGSLSEALTPGPQRAPPRGFSAASQKPLHGASQLYLSLGPVFNIQRKITVHFHTQYRHYHYAHVYV